MRFLGLIFIFFILSLSVHAEVFEHKSDLQTISKNLPQIESIQCKFIQEKTLKNIQKPVISGGDFEFKKGEGVYFYTNYPIKTVSSYTSQNYKDVNRIINEISNKKYSRLEKDFDFYLEKNKSNWTLGLTPKNKNTAEFIAYIIIKGNDYIQEINITQTNGNKTTLWFKKEDL